MEYIMGFGSAHNALRAESILEEKTEISFRLLPAPKALESYCALVILINEEDLAKAKAVLEQDGLPPRSVYRKEGDDYVKV